MFISVVMFIHISFLLLLLFLKICNLKRKRKDKKALFHMGENCIRNNLLVFFLLYHIVIYSLMEILSNFVTYQL